MSIIYKKGNVFGGLTKDTYLLHACNCKGVWGAGIAKVIKQEYPEAFEDYADRCKRNPGSVLGNYQLYKPVISIFVSDGYGQYKDSPREILEGTISALNELLKEGPINIVSPRINAGLFNVPWEETEKLINNYLKMSGSTWTVYSL